jgi:hypothetical protein
MKNKDTVMMRIPVGVHIKLKEIKKATERSFIWILTRAISNYWKATIGNRLNKKG